MVHVAPSSSLLWPLRSPVPGFQKASSLHVARRNGVFLWKDFERATHARNRPQHPKYQDDSNTGPGQEVLEVGAGDLYLSNLISKDHQVTATDVYFAPEMVGQLSKNISLVQAPIEHLPFPNQDFDTVICTHTLEHVLDVRVAMTELRRVARKRLIVVVPKQRSYRYTFDPHLHFFPYDFSLRLALGKPIGPTTCKLIGGDWFYVEEIPVDAGPSHSVSS